MNIAILHPHLNIYGGSERLTKILYEELLKENFNVYLLSLRFDKEWFPNLKNVIKLSEENPEKNLTQILKEISPEIFISMIQEPYYCYIAKKVISDIKTGMYIHFPLDEEISEENIKRYIENFRYPFETIKYIKYVDVCFVNSRRTKLVTKFLWGIDSKVVYPCIDSIFFKSEPNFERKKPRILYVGRFNTLKRQDFLILMFKYIKEKVPNAEIFLAGYVDARHKEYFDRIKTILDEIEDELRDVYIEENPSENRLIELYKSAKVYVHPRIGEHFGLAPIEAMSQGTPVVVRAPTGLAEIMENGIQGFIAWTDYDLAEFTMKVLKMDEHKYKEMQKNAYKLSLKFKPDVFTKEIIKSFGIN